MCGGGEAGVYGGSKEILEAMELHHKEIMRNGKMVL